MIHWMGFLTRPTTVAQVMPHNQVGLNTLIIEYIIYE